MIDYRYWSLKKKIAVILTAGLCVLSLLYVRNDHKQKTRYEGRDFNGRVAKFNDTIKTLEEKIAQKVHGDAPLKEAIDKARAMMRTTLGEEMHDDYYGANLEDSIKRLREDYDVFRNYTKRLAGDKPDMIDTAFTAVEMNVSRLISQREQPESLPITRPVGIGIPVQPKAVAVSSSGTVTPLPEPTEEEKIRRQQERMLASWPLALSAAQQLASREMLPALADANLRSVLDTFRLDLRKALGSGPTAADEQPEQALAGLQEDLKSLQENASEVLREARLSLTKDYWNLNAAYIRACLSEAEQRFQTERDNRLAQRKLTQKDLNRLVIEHVAYDLALLRSALDAWHKENGEACPWSIQELAPRYFTELPFITLPGYARTNTLTILTEDPKPDTLSASQDSGGWLYISDQTSPRCGTLLVDSKRKNPKGKIWLGM